MHFANVLEPWILLRLAAGLVAVVLFTRAARTSLRILRRFDVARATEGQLALERQAELSATFVRVGAVLQVVLLALSMLAADRLSAGIRGAMCAYGVFHATAWGFRSLAATALTAVAAAVVTQLHALDDRVRSFTLARPLAIMTLILAPLAAIDLGLACAFAFDLDLSVVASCCSVQLDAVAAGVAGPASQGASARDVATLGASVGVALAIALAVVASRKPRLLLVVASAGVSLAALPFALAAAVLEVAPHAFELPQHVCPFCLLRPMALGLGYPLFGAVFLAVTWALGAGGAALLAHGRADARAAFEPFARERLRRGAVAWAAALALGALPIARYAIVTGGASLFP
jgi:hypothetical protein